MQSLQPRGLHGWNYSSDSLCGYSDAESYTFSHTKSNAFTDTIADTKPNTKPDARTNAKYLHTGLRCNMRA